MTIQIGQNIFDFKDFLFKKQELTEQFASCLHASDFLTEWISGGKRFEISTSGSSGDPKKIILLRKWMETSALQTIQVFGLWDEKIYCCIPTFKIGGLMMIVRALAGGFDLLIREPEVDPMAELPPSHPYTFLSLVPYQLRIILENAESRTKLNRFRNVLIGGADLNPELIRQIQGMLPNFYHTYGMTETCSHIALKKLNHGAEEHFKPLPGIELRSGQDQCLSIRGFQTGNEWVHTSDQVRMNEDNSFDFVGRADFAINTGGFKVFPEILEQKIRGILQVNQINAEVVITSKPHPYLGQQVVLLLAGNQQTSEKTILALLKPLLEKYELPRIFQPVESFPLNEGGKINRKLLPTLVG